MASNNKIYIYRTLVMVGSIGASIGMGGCAAATSTATTTAAAISGTLSLSSASSARSALTTGRGIATQASIAADTTISCFDPDGELVGESAVATDGTFNIEASNTKALSCSVLVGDAVQGSFIFENSAQKGLDGNSQKTDSIQFAAATNIGAVSLDSGTGNATVDIASFVANIAKVAVDPAKVVALTGHYLISDLAAIPAPAIAAGYKGVCAADAPQSGAGQCQGPPDGFPLYLKLVHGTVTANASDVYGMLLWQSKTSFDACGSVVGASAAEISSSLGVVFDEGAGDYTYSTTASVNGVTKTLLDNWKISDATSSYTMSDCGPFSEGDTHGWECTDSSGAKQRNRAGGCYLTGTTTPVMPDQSSDWGNMTCSSETLADGYSKSSCAGSLAVNGTSTSVTCINESKVLTAAGAVGTHADFNWNSVGVKIAQGALCSSAADPLVGLQCYSNAYYESGIERGSAGGCAKRISTNWTATSAEDFISVRGPSGSVVRALGTIGLNGKGEPSLTGLSFNEEYRGVEIQDSSGNRMYVPCRVGNKEKISISKSDTDGILIATYESYTVNLDTDVPACAAEFTGAAEKFMFKLTSITDAAAEAALAAFEAAQQQ